MLSEHDIYETFMEYYGIQSIDQCQGDYIGRQQAKEMTRDWLIERGHEHAQARTMVSKMFRNYRDKI